MDNHRTETSLEDRSVLKREKRFKSQRPKECGRPVENVTRNRLTQEGQLLIFMKKGFFQSVYASGMCELPLDQNFPVKLNHLPKY